jgi:multimeric flavodoxin WrbA
MKKVVAFIASPRKNGNTATLVNEVIKGAKEAGAETKVFDLYNMDIKPCRACMVCRKTGACQMKDDFQDIYKYLIEADVIVFGSPIYCLQVSAQMKLLWDRLCIFFDENFKPRFGTKSVVMVYSQGAPYADAFESSFKSNENMLKELGLNVVNTIHLTGGNPYKAAEVNEELLLKAFEVGKTV